MLTFAAFLAESTEKQYIWMYHPSHGVISGRSAESDGKPGYNTHAHMYYDAQEKHTGARHFPHYDDWHKGYALAYGTGAGRKMQLDHSTDYISDHRHALDPVAVVDHFKKKHRTQNVTLHQYDE